MPTKRTGQTPALSWTSATVRAASTTMRDGRMILEEHQHDVHPVTLRVRGERLDAGDCPALMRLGWAMVAADCSLARSSAFSSIFWLSSLSRHWLRVFLLSSRVQSRPVAILPPSPFQDASRGTMRDPTREDHPQGCSANANR